MTVHSAEPSSSSGDDRESAAHFLKGEVGWLDKVAQLGDFVRTRDAIRAGEPVFDYTDAEIASRRYMGPLRFNTYQTIISAIPTYLVTTVVGGVRPEPSLTSLKPTPFVHAFADALAKIHDVVGPLVTPVVLLVGAWVFSWSVLRREDLTPGNRRRARRAELYFDGAYGLFPEAALMLVLAVMPMVGLPLTLLTWVYVLIGYSAFFAYLEPRTVPGLFGYASIEDDYGVISLKDAQDRRPPPKMKMVAGVGARIVALYVCVQALVWFQIIVALAAAMALTLTGIYRA